MVVLGVAAAGTAALNSRCGWCGDVPSLSSRWVLAAVSGHTGWLLPPPKPEGQRVLSCVLFVAKFSPRPPSCSVTYESTQASGPTPVPSVPIGPFKPRMSNRISPDATTRTNQHPDHPGTTSATLTR